MINYDSHSTFSMLRLNGSLVPMALRTAAVAAFAAYVLKWAEIEGYAGFLSGMVKDGSLYSSFSFTLAFMLVFRTSQSYQRFWQAASQINSMRSQWYEAASSLCKFVEMSQASSEEVLIFRHTLVRLFSMLGGTAMAALADMKDDEYSVVDIASFSHSDLAFLMEREDERHRPSVVYQWIQSLIVKNIQSGLLNVPAPMLSRVFQQMEKGMVDYSQVLLIQTTPFPFPYTQICWLLVHINMICTPLVMSRWTDEAWVAALSTLISVMCINTISLIATEIENPLGDDVNDLPCHQYHNEFNEHLVLLLQPGTLKPPALLGTALMNPDALVELLQKDGKSVKQYYAERLTSEKDGKSLKQYYADLKSAPLEEKDNTDTILNVGAQGAIGACGQAAKSLAKRPAEQPHAMTCSGAGVGEIAVASGTSVLVPLASTLKDFVDDLSQNLLQSQKELNSLLLRQVKASEKLFSMMVVADRAIPKIEPAGLYDSQNTHMPVMGLLSVPLRKDLVLKRCPCPAGSQGTNMTGTTPSKQLNLGSGCGF